MILVIAPDATVCHMAVKLLMQLHKEENPSGCAVPGKQSSMTEWRDAEEDFFILFSNNVSQSGLFLLCHSGLPSDSAILVD